MRLSTLRPRSIPELVDQAVRLYRRYFLKFTGIVAVALIPITALQVLASLLSSAPLFFSPSESPASASLFPLSTLASLGVSTGNGLLYFLLIQGVASALLTRAFADHLLGEPVGLLASFRRLRGDWAQLLVALVLAYLLSVALTIWFLIPCVGWFTGGGMVSFFSTAIIPMLVPVVVIEKQKAVQAIRRAWELTRRRFWPVLGFAVLLWLFQQAVIAGPAALFFTLFLWAVTTATASDNIGLFFASQAVFQALTIMFGNVLFVPLQVTAANMLYLDLRVRGEGLDLALRAGDVRGVPSTEVIQQAPPAAGPWFRREDWRNFVLFSLITLGLIALFMVLYFGLVYAFIAARIAD